METSVDILENLHIQKVIAGLKKLQDYNGRRPDYLLYIGPTSYMVTMPSLIDGIPVIETGAYISPKQYNTIGEVWYLPCYTRKKSKQWEMFGIYVVGYDSYDGGNNEV